MDPPEIAARARDRARRRRWAGRRVRPTGQPPAWPPEGLRTLRPPPAPLPPGTAATVPDRARADVIAAAERLLDGQWSVFGVNRSDMDAPDWFLDPVSGRRAPQDRLAFRVNHRAPNVTGDVKQVWELSRHHHLTLLATAWFLTGDDRHAAAVDRQLRSWWRENPFLSGVHWTSGIEIGIRLLAWVWIRRLLDGWPHAAELFEENPAATHQIRWHQSYLATFRSTGSSANNHVIAEAAGQLVASCGFPWFEESEQWRKEAAVLLEDQLQRNVFASGVNRELAGDYHGFTAELGLLAAVEAEAAGHPLGEPTWARLAAMVDAAAALVDHRLRPPRQGDGDEGRALVLDGGEVGSWSAALSLGATVFGRQRWWPAEPATVVGTLPAALVRRPRQVGPRPADRPSTFADAGIVLLRTSPLDGPEIWCRFDAGPHGFLSIAAHAHADALAVEVRHGGVDILADPGTYCYHGGPEWRAYFRSTLAHNTLEVGGVDQAVSGGPFLWLSHADAHLLHAAADPADARHRWTAEHDGYRRLRPPAVHRRSVTLDERARTVEIDDRLVTAGEHVCRLAFHLGPAVSAELDGPRAELRWEDGHAARSATLSLPAGLDWRAHRGETAPVLGWYSTGFGRLLPATALIGSGSCSAATPLLTVLRFAD